MRHRIHAIAIPSEVGEFADEVRRIFLELGRAFGREFLSGECTPPVDVYETDEAVVRASARFTGLHVADELPEPTPGVRGLPGPEGRSAEIVAALRANGWDGMLDVEIFSTPDHFWALPPDEAARRAYAAASALA